MIIQGPDAESVITTTKTLIEGAMVNRSFRKSAILPLSAVVLNNATVLSTEEDRNKVISSSSRVGSDSFFYICLSCLVWQGADKTLYIFSVCDKHRLYCPSSPQGITWSAYFTAPRLYTCISTMHLSIKQRISVSYFFQPPPRSPSQLKSIN